MSENRPTLKECLAHGEKIRKRCREALIHIGKSPDYHIYDLEYEELFSLRESRERNYLIKVKQYFDGLSTKQRRIFVAEVLEKDRIYPFWFYDERYEMKDYEQHRRAFLLSLRSAL